MEKKHIPVTLTQEEINNIVSSMPITMNMLAGNEKEAEKYRHINIFISAIKRSFQISMSSSSDLGSLHSGNSLKISSCPGSASEDNENSPRFIHSS